MFIPACIFAGMFLLWNSNKGVVPTLQSRLLLLPGAFSQFTFAPRCFFLNLLYPPGAFFSIYFCSQVRLHNDNSYLSHIVCFAADSVDVKDNFTCFTKFLGGDHHKQAHRMLHRPEDYCQPFIVKRDPVVGRCFPIKYLFVCLIYLIPSEI